ncbi:MAG: hypothetical protein JWR83_2027 [Aeromicrobium sp.]|nr:hypothetical protein [Aeromicrobium sp.]
MRARSNTKRLAKRFLVTFALVGVVVAVAAAISGGSDQSKSDGLPSGSSETDGTVPTKAAAGLPSTGSEYIVTSVASSARSTTTAVPQAARGPLPTPDLAAFCVKTAERGATVGAVDAAFNFPCVSADGTVSGPIRLDIVCADQFGTHSRHVTLLRAPQELRCVPSRPILVGRPDFDAYCRLAHGQTARVSRIASDRKGWRCVGLPNGVFNIFDVDFVGHETDLACQVTIDGEAYAADDDGITDKNAPWACYAGP